MKFNVYKKTYFLISSIIILVIATFLIFFQRFQIYQNSNTTQDHNIAFIKTNEQNLLKERKFFQKIITDNYLNKSLEVKFFTAVDDDKKLHVHKKIQINPKMFQYYFLKIIITTKKPFKLNIFNFIYDKNFQQVQVKYSFDNNNIFLSWFFKIIKK